MAVNPATDTAMRLAFWDATQNIPTKYRTAVYAMVRSAFNRRIGQTRPKTGWTAPRAAR